MQQNVKMSTIKFVLIHNSGIKRVHIDMVTLKIPLTPSQLLPEIRDFVQYPNAVFFVRKGLDAAQFELDSFDLNVIDK